jgi:hypothetical protein
MALLKDKPFDQAVCVLDTAPAMSATSAARGRPRNGCFVNGRQRRKTATRPEPRQACLDALKSVGETEDACQAFRAAARACWRSQGSMS